MKLAFLCFSLLAAGLPAAASPVVPISVAIHDFKGEGPGEYPGRVSALITADLSAKTNLALVERSELNKALDEQSLGLSGIISSDAAARVGQITGAKVLVSGRVLKLQTNRRVVIANIIGTETARLFAAKVEGQYSDLEKLTSELSSQIEQIIVAQATNLVKEAPGSNASRMARIVKNITGTNRPTVSVQFLHPGPMHGPSFTGNTEMGIILQNAGFVVVDGQSDRKPDVEITGMVDVDGFVRGQLHVEHAVVEMKIRERRTGRILVIDRQESAAVDGTQVGAQRSAQALAVDQLAERTLPLLAK